MKPIEEAMLVPGRIEKLTIILDFGNKNFVIPIMSDYRKIISKVATAYMHRADKIIMINSSFVINIMYKSNKRQLEEETSKIIVINSNE